MVHHLWSWIRRLTSHMRSLASPGRGHVESSGADVLWGRKHILPLKGIILSFSHFHRLHRAHGTGESRPPEPRPLQKILFGAIRFLRSVFTRLLAPKQTSSSSSWWPSPRERLLPEGHPWSALRTSSYTDFIWFLRPGHSGWLIWMITTKLVPLALIQLLSTN
jgi:hypothetical protein